MLSSLRWVLCLLTIAMLPNLASGVTGDLRRYHYAQVHMGVRASITLYAPSEDEARAAARAAFARIGALDAILSDYRVDSDLTRVNEAAGGEPVEVDPELIAVLIRCDEIHMATGGAFNPAVGPLVMQWRQARQTGQLAAPAEIAYARAASRWDWVEIDEDQHTVRLAQPGMRLDLGGIGKGYAAQAGVEVLQAHGIARCLVALAGDIVAGDPPPGEVGWPVEVELSPSDRYAITLANEAVSTSGDTEQFVEIQGVRYSHIVDPATGLGKTVLTSASVIAPDGATADALATAVSIAGLEYDNGLYWTFPRCGIAVAQSTDRGLCSSITTRYIHLVEAKMIAPDRERIGNRRR